MRGTLRGHRIEVSTGTVDEPAALVFLINFERQVLAEWDRDDEEARRRTPQPISLGAFERWLMAAYSLHGEAVMHRASWAQVQFHGNGKGYRAAKIPYLDDTRTVLEHRFKFLLAHQWLPSTVDHADRDRGNNALVNLRAATATTQAANRRFKIRAGKS